MSGQAAAHPAEQALVLLLPTELYTMGGTAAVAASILLISFLPVHLLDRIYGTREVRVRFGLIGWSRLTSCSATLGMFGLISIGAFGPTDPQANLLPLMIWTGLWIAVFVVQGLVFNIWLWINPWTGVFDILNGTRPALLTLPKGLSAWPAVALFVSFQIFMLADIAPSDPRRLANLLLVYWIFTLAGMIVFGRNDWLERVECFSVLMRLLGTLRPLHWTDKLRIGIPTVACKRMILDPSRASFCLIILISGSFDGVKESFWWLGLIGINPLEFPGRSAVALQSVLGLLAANALVIGAFVASLWIGIQLVRHLGSGPSVTLRSAYCRFAVTILPIALGYHIAHYLVTFMVQGQYLLATLGDPFARGWNLLGLGQMRVTTGFLNTPQSVRLIHLTTVWAVVLSHIVSVVLAHRLAGHHVTGRRDLVLLQLGLSLFMIAYTLFGLWLLSTPRGA